MPPDPGGAGDVDVRVYFTVDEAVATAGRVVDGPAVARGAVEALLEGPRGIEIELGQVSEIPDGTELTDIDIADGTAAVALSSEFGSGGDSASMQLRTAQVVFTLTQFETVESVEIAIAGEGVLVDGVDRTDFDEVTPLILVETPVPGQSVSSPIEITGMSNTFEANVQYMVTDGEGLVIDEGFTTATAGNGTFGRFSIASEFTLSGSSTGLVTVFEQSAETGEFVNVYEVPVDIG